MLPAPHRLLDSAAFRRATREGRRAGTRTLVLHLASSDDGPGRVGFVVSRAVGSAVVRNRVRRRLRHLAREHLAALPAGSVLVVRALPAAATAPARVLREDLAHALHRLTGAPS